MSKHFLLGSCSNAILAITLQLVLISIDTEAQCAERNYVLTRHMLDTCGTSYSTHISYCDGIGRPVLTCASVGQGTYACELSVYGYGGTVSSRYVPVPGDGEWMTAGEATLEGQSVNSGEDRLYSSVDHDALKRPICEMGPGTSWVTGNHAVSYSYGTNYTGEVRQYKVSGQELTLSGNYAPGSLHSTIKVDEDGLSCTVFTDLQGRVVMTRDNTGAETYYVLDDWGDPLVIIPPAASASMSSGGPWDMSSSNDIRRWCYVYTYDERHRRVSAQLPGCEGTIVCYDTADRPVFTQNGVQRAAGRCSFFLYDHLGRTTVSGTCLSTCMTSPLASTATTSYSGLGVYGGYTCPMSLQDMELLTVTWYDSYGFMNSLSDDSLSFSAITGYVDQAACATGLMTGQATYSAVGGGTPLLTVYFYDAEGRIVQQRSTNILSGHEIIATAYTFNGNPSKRMHRHTASGRAPISEITNYMYDNHTSRLLSITHSVNGSAPVTLASYTYDTVGRMATKTTGGIETTTYTYNVRSWLTKISGQLFTERLCYNDAVEGLAPALAHQYRWNGTVAAYGWNAGGETRQRGYSLLYDGQDRLTAANYGEGWNLTAYHTKYDEKAEYDVMGNPTWIYRKSPLTIDDVRPSSPSDRLRLEYDGNQLVHVTDTVTSGHNYEGAFHFNDGADQAVEYEYDANGNMTKDLNRNISQIQYNLLNLPSMVKFGDSHYIFHTYSAAGEKLKTEYQIQLHPVLSPQAGEGSTQEAGGVSEAKTENTRSGPVTPIDTDHIYYCGNVVYDQGVTRLLTDEGYVTFSETGAPIYHYYLRDHLGNIRVVMEQTGTVEQVNHYYAFGGLMRESTNPGLQPYKYGGKELDRYAGLDAYDFGARSYFADRMQWSTMDPLCEKYYDVSPYGYCGNNPIIRIDRDGMIWETIWDAGNVVYDLGAATYHHFMGHNAEVKKSLRDAKWDTVAMVAPGVPAGASKVTKLLNFIGTAVHANSRTSSRAQHVYRIFEQTSNETVKVGVSSGRIARNGKSYRGNRQVNSWNKAEGSPKYDSEIIEQIPAGKNARSKALEREKYHSKRYPHMKKYGKHIKP